MNRGGVALDVFSTGYEVLRETPARTRLLSRESCLEVANVDWKDRIKGNDMKCRGKNRGRSKNGPGPTLQLKIWRKTNDLLKRLGRGQVKKSETRHNRDLGRGLKEGSRRGK